MQIVTVNATAVSTLVFLVELLHIHIPGVMVQTHRTFQVFVPEHIVLQLQMQTVVLLTRRPLFLSHGVPFDVPRQRSGVADPSLEYGLACRHVVSELRQRRQAAADA